MINGDAMLNNGFINDITDIDELFSISDLNEIDMGRYTMKHLPGSDCLFTVKMDRSNELLTIMETYRQQQKFCDVILSVNGIRYSAHKIVLAASSTHFFELFDSENQFMALPIQDIDCSSFISSPMVMSLILEFIYTSQIKLNEEHVMGLLTSAMALQINDLIEFCVVYLKNQLHASNCIGLLLFGKQHQCTQLIDAAQSYIFEHFEEVVRHEEFLTLKIPDLCTLVKDDKVKVKCETIVYNSVMQWYRHDPANRKDVVEQILPCIRLHLLDPAILRRLMEDDDLAAADMKKCREYVNSVHENLVSHRYYSLPPRRAPLKPLVIYCAGGYHNKSLSTTDCYYLPTKQWKQCADLQIPRSGVGVVSLHMRVYVIGGRHNTKTINKDCRDVERYDPFMNKWTTIASMIHPRNRLGVGAIDFYIYAVGGSSGQQIYSSVERLRVGCDSEIWTEVAPMSIGRIGLCVCVHSRLLYAIGGFDGHHRLADVESYDPDKNIWKREQPLRVGRSGAAAAALNECIYVVGGYASDIIEGPMQLDVVEEYNIITQQWTIIKPMNIRRSALSCVALDNQLFALGGYDGKTFSSVVEIYDPTKGEWTFGTPLNSERSGHGSALTVEPTLEDE